jgi:hypothetical protein
MNKCSKRLYWILNLSWCYTYSLQSPVVVSPWWSFTLNSCWQLVQCWWWFRSSHCPRWGFLSLFCPRWWQLEGPSTCQQYLCGLPWSFPSPAHRLCRVSTRWICSRGSPWVSDRWRGDPEPYVWDLLKDTVVASPLQPNRLHRCKSIFLFVRWWAPPL